MIEYIPVSYTHLMQAAGAWLFAVPLLLLSIFRDHVTYGNEIQMLLAIPVLLFLGVSL